MVKAFLPLYLEYISQFDVSCFFVIMICYWIRCCWYLDSEFCYQKHVFWSCSLWIFFRKNLLRAVVLILLTFRASVVILELTTAHEIHMSTYHCVPLSSQRHLSLTTIHYTYSSQHIWLVAFSHC